MKIKVLIMIVLMFSCHLLYGQSKYQQDFNEFWNDVNDHYAYLNQQNIDWNKVKEIYEPQTKGITSDRTFIKFLERVLNELYNGHTSLNVNLSSSNRLVPSGQDMRVEKINNDFIITDLRKGFGAEKSGLKIGMKVIEFNRKPIEQQLKQFLPKFTQHHNAKMYQYALDMLFSGTHNKEREILVSNINGSKFYFPDKIKAAKPKALLTSETINQNTAYIKINNSLGNNQLIFDFDRTLNQYLNFKNLIIDLTDTPSGGNTTVARAMMGRFINEEQPYQRHEFDEKQFDTKRVWLEFVTPRKTQYKGNLYILVGHWTGSMGEGLAIGFDGMKRATIIGTKMAGLLGAISNFGLSQTGIGYQFPTERLYHINGQPREDFIPTIKTRNIEETLSKVKEIR